MTTTIDVAAQFGGRDAAQALLPHFRALKSAAKGMIFDGFPFPNLTFILRVDGEVNAYGQSGAGNIQLDKKGEYVSVDIGITREDLSGRAVAEVSAFVVGAIMSSLGLIKGSTDSRFKGVDEGALEAALRAFTASYEAKDDAVGGDP